jgi:SAM-dependent methyltransferase
LRFTDGFGFVANVVGGFANGGVGRQSFSAWSTVSTTNCVPSAPQLSEIALVACMSREQEASMNSERGAGPADGMIGAARWEPDEVALSGVTALTRADVDVYEQRLGFDPTEEIGLLVRLGLDGSARLIEFGPGPGRFAIAAAAVAGEVVAVDPSPVLVAHLTERVATLGLTNLEVVRAGFLSYRHQGTPAQFVFSKNALHHLSDFWKMEALVRIHRLLEPGGVLRLRDQVFAFPPEEAAARIAAWIDEARTTEGGWSPEQLENHVRTEFSTYAWMLEEMLERAGFAIEDLSYDEGGIYTRYTCRRS